MKKAETKSSIVLVGTYRPENETWIRVRRLYNLPLPKCGKLAFHEKISAIVLFAEEHPNFAFKAKFKEVVDGKWLAANGYIREGGASARPHAAAYALYELLEESTPAKLLGRKFAEVFVSSSRCPAVRIDEAFYSRPYPVTGGKSMPYVFDCLKPYFRKWKSATTFNPVQENFFQDNFGFDYGLQVAREIVARAKQDDELTCVEICAGAGAVGGTYEAGEARETGVATCETDACPSGRHRIRKGALC